MFACTAMILSSGCAIKKQNQWLDDHKRMLETAAFSKSSPERKMDALATSFVDMMGQTIRFTNPKKGAEYGKKYFDQNNKSIDRILKEVGTWQEGMSGPAKLSTAFAMVKKPYSKDLVDLYPKFRRKYKTYAFLMKMSGKIGKGVLGLGGKAWSKLLSDADGLPDSGDACLPEEELCMD